MAKASPRRRRRFRNALATARLLRRMPEVLRDEIAALQEEAGRELSAKAKSEAPVKTGRLRAAISYRVLRRTLKLRVGIIGRALNRRVRYGYVLDAGRGNKKKETTVTRRNRSGTVSTYTMRISPIAPNRYDFVFGRRKDFVRSFRPRMQKLWERVLSKAAGAFRD